MPIISLRTATSNRQERTFYLLILLEIVISAERPAVVCLFVMFRFIRVVVFGLSDMVIADCFPRPWASQDTLLISSLFKSSSQVSN